MGRRWGKTILGGALTLATASSGSRVAWCVPAYRNGRPLWRWAEATVGPLRRGGHVRVDRSERIISFPDQGGWLGIYSMDNPDSIRGESFDLVIIDEAAMIPEEAWTDAIQPTLADTGGQGILISTPKGRNWFWREWIRGQGDGEDTASFTAPTSANPSMLIQRAALLARERVPERTYRQEWLAEFIEDGGGVYRNVRELATEQPLDGPEKNHHYVMGVDLARRVDYTVAIVLDVSVTPRVVVAMDRFHQVEWQVQVERLKALAQRFHVETLVVDQTGVGDPVVEQLQRELAR
jgi:hypothetical protein